MIKQLSRIKVWISGYSRAAAVSNVTAGTLVNTGFLHKEDVYAYTFATPAAILEPPKEGYENIFNIIDPADLAPQVMPAEWGYGRYGADLFLPVQEFSSYSGFLGSLMRNAANRKQYGVEYHYSPALTLRTRLLMSLVLNLADNPAGAIPGIAFRTARCFRARRFFYYENGALIIQYSRTLPGPRYAAAAAREYRRCRNRFQRPFPRRRTARSARRPGT